VGILALPANIVLAGKKPSGTNAPAYFVAASAEKKKKSFVTLRACLKNKSTERSTFQVFFQNNSKQKKTLQQRNLIWIIFNVC